jgi:HEAT repeat protein
VACALLAALAGYAWIGRGLAPARDTPAASAPGRAGALPAALRRPLRVNAAAAGISTSDLVDRLLAARSIADVQILAAKIAIVGDDAAVERLAPLLGDPRRGVPEIILGTFGQIGTELAVGHLVAAARDDRPSVRHAAIASLGASQSAAGEELLLGIARTASDPAQSAAISALGALGSRRAIEALTALAGDLAQPVALAAIGALGAAAVPEAQAAIRQLTEASDPRVAAAAIAHLDEIDAPLLARLARLAKSGDPQLVYAALVALVKARDAALPALRDAALHGSMEARWMAVSAIGEISGPAAVSLLGDVLRTGDRQTAMAAAGALASAGGPEARATLIEVALSDRGALTGALAQIAQLQGEDIDAALLTVIQRGTPSERRTALPRLLKAGHAAAIDAAVALVATGPRHERLEVMRMLADSGAPRAWGALIDHAGKARGASRVAALEMLAQARPADAAVGQLLSDSMFSGRRDEARYAATVLGRLGTEESRQALIAALADRDSSLAAAAVAALGGAAHDDAVKGALIAAAQGSPHLARPVMEHLLRVGAPEGLRLAEELLRGNDASAASQLVAAVGSLGTSAARRVVARALESRDPSVRAAAIATLGQSSDEASTDALLRLVRDEDGTVRAAALQTLGQVGSSRAQAALLDAARGGRPEERAAAIASLGNLDDPRVSDQIAVLIRDPDPRIAQAAVQAAQHGGPEIDQALTRIVNDPRAAPELRSAAAGQLRGRGTDLDDATEQVVTQLAGPAYGGGMYADI